jgi:hypothetical protein
LLITPKWKNPKKLLPQEIMGKTSEEMAQKKRGFREK